MAKQPSLQHKLDRVRPPRVQITYDVETNGSEIRKELPFVVGVLADLSGHPDPDKVDPYADREFTNINRDNFEKVMAAIGPRLAIRVPNQLEKDGTKIGVELKFDSVDDFEPENVVNKIEPLRLLLEARQRLADLKTKVVSNDRLDVVLQRILQATEAMKKQRVDAARVSGDGVSGPGPAATAEEV
jgi:type VI secretion system protein ImpB